MDRVAAFLQFIADRPDDPFPRYGLAMEHKAQGRLDEAQAVFDELARKFPDYVPLYLMSGNNLATLGRVREAAEIYRTGMDVSARCGDNHARSELVEALADLDETA